MKILKGKMFLGISINLLYKIKKYIFLILIFILNYNLEARPYLKIQQVRSNNYPSVTIEVSVAKFTPITNLSQKHFTLYENNAIVPYFQIQPVNIEYDPKTVILLINSSNSLTKEEFTLQIKAAQDFVNTIHTNDRVIILSFDSHVNRDCSSPVHITTALQCLNSIEQSNESALLYDAVREAYNVKNTSIKNNRSAIILFSRGTDAGSIINVEDLIKELNIPIFILATGEPSKELSLLAKVAKNSGGEIYNITDLSNLSKVYVLINQILDSTYIIQYISQISNLTNNKKNVNLGVILKSQEVNEDDTYSFIIPGFSKMQLIGQLKYDAKYILYVAGLIIIALFFLIFILLLRKTSVQVELLDSSNISKPTINIKTKLSKNKKETKPTGDTQNQDTDYWEADNYLTPTAKKVEGKQVTSTTKKDIKNQELKKNNIVQKKKTDTQNNTLIDEDTMEQDKNALALLVKEGGENNGKKYFIKKESITIGSSEMNDVILSDTLISKKHAKIVYRDDEFIIYDLLSDSGIMLNQKKILGPKILHDFDEIQLGMSKLIFRIPE